MREAGAAAFAVNGFPTVQNEAWRYTNLRPLEKVAFEPAEPRTGAPGFDVLPTVRAAGTSATRLVFVDGRFRHDLSSAAGLPNGVEVAGLADRLAGEPGWIAGRLGRLIDVEANPLAALNTAFLGDGAVLRIGRGVEVHAMDCGLVADSIAWLAAREAA